MNYIKIGFWKEYRNEDSLLIQDIVLNSNVTIEQQCLDYLKKGIELGGYRTIVFCSITGKEIGVPLTYTDGKWIWTAEYIFYLEQGLELDSRLKRQIIQNNFICPKEEDVDSELLDDIDEALMYNRIPDA